MTDVAEIRCACVGEDVLHRRCEIVAGELYEAKVPVLIISVRGEGDMLATVIGAPRVPYPYIHLSISEKIGRGHARSIVQEAISAVYYSMLEEDDLSRRGGREYTLRTPQLADSEKREQVPILSEDLVCLSSVAMSSSGGRERE